MGFPNDRNTVCWVPNFSESGFEFQLNKLEVGKNR
ncbi:hypothetical protein SAMN05421755_105116 [Nitrosomonas sp. Nm33]|nr:hypothetical protein SAMN05421755_105116 [Nitrosomonas sp. Nm33]